MIRVSGGGKMENNKGAGQTGWYGKHYRESVKSDGERGAGGGEGGDERDVSEREAPRRLI